MIFLFQIDLFDLSHELLGAEILIVTSASMIYFIENRSYIHHLFSIFVCLNEVEWLMVQNIILFVCYLFGKNYNLSFEEVNNCIFFSTSSKCSKNGVH
jgi:hypothetical protein